MAFESCISVLIDGPMKRAYKQLIRQITQDHMIATKRCNICKTKKALVFFSRHHGTRDGRDSSCKPCKGAQTKRWRKANLG